MKENKHQTKQDFIKTINNSMWKDLKSKQIFRVCSTAGFEWKQRGTINRKKKWNYELVEENK